MSWSPVRCPACFVERTYRYIFNDGAEDKLIGNHIVLAMEQLLRRLLALPSRPAVVLMQVPMVRKTDFLGFHETSEDLEGGYVLLLPTDLHISSCLLQLHLLLLLHAYVKTRGC